MDRNNFDKTASGKNRSYDDTEGDAFGVPA